MHSELDRAEPDPGAVLRAARQARGLSIDDLVRTTKINAAVLVALEQNDVEKLPAMIFSRGFLKAYAREVGLDPEVMARQYFGQLQAEPAGVDTPTVVESVHVVAAPPTGPFRGLATIAAMVGLVVYVWAVNRAASGLTGNETARAAATSVVAEGTASSPMDATPAGASLPGTLEPSPLQLELRPQGPCWLSASADGSPVLSRLLKAGDHQTIEVRDELVLRVGDPGALSFSINGQTGRVLGRAGQPVNVRITKDNFREFLSSL